MRKLVIVAALLVSAGSAKAEVGLGLFVGAPIGLDLKLDIAPRASVDLLFGWSNIPRADRSHYAHITFLGTPFVSYGESIVVPLRLGVGIAVYDDDAFNTADVAVRAPLELALKFRRTPLEIYGEIAAEITFVDNFAQNDFFDVQGGVGIRVYF